MSVAVFNDAGLNVVRYVGPKQEDDDRQYWQFVLMSPARAVLTRSEVEKLIVSLEWSLER